MTTEPNKQPEPKIVITCEFLLIACSCMFATVAALLFLYIAYTFLYVAIDEHSVPILLMDMLLFYITKFMWQIAAETGE